MTKSIKLGIVFLFDIFRGSSMVEQLPVKELVVGSSPTRGARKLDTNSDFEDERVRPSAENSYHPIWLPN